MAVIIPSNHFQVVIHFDSPNYTDGEALVTLGVRNTADEDPSLVAEAVAAVLETSNLDAFLDDAVTVTLVEAFTPEFSGQATLTLEGQQTQAMLPPNCCLLVEKRTQRRGRRAQGRNFWPSLVQESIVDERGNITPANVTDYQALMDELFEALVTSGNTPVVLQGDDGVSPPITPPPSVTRFVVDPMISTQRRRLRR